MTTFTPGTNVRFTRNDIGLVRYSNSIRFVEQRANEGDLGVYGGPHPRPELFGEDWHLVLVDGLIAPVHVSMFEVITCPTCGTGLNWVDDQWHCPNCGNEFTEEN